MQRRTLTLFLALLLLVVPMLSLFSSCIALPDQILCETDSYIIERKNGNCYLNFKNGNEKDNITQGGCVIPADYISFYEFEEMIDTISSGHYTDDDLTTIRNFFPRNEDDSIIMPDPKNLFLPTLPENFSVHAYSFRGDKIRCGIHSGNEISSDSGMFATITQDKFDSELEFWESLKNRSSDYRYHVVGEYSAIVIDNPPLPDSYTDKTSRNVFFQFNKHGRTYYIRHHYASVDGIPPADWNTIGTGSVQMLIQDDESYYEVSVNFKNTFLPDQDWYTAFGTKKHID